MKIVMVGAGGVGAYYGARLQAAGHEVVFVARGQQLDAMRHAGLQVNHPHFQFHHQVVAVDEGTLQVSAPVTDFDLIILALKSNATYYWANTWWEWLNENGATTPVLSLQNGVDNERMIAQAIGRERTLGGLSVRLGAHISEPGVVQATGVAQIIMGYWPNHDINPAPKALLEWKQAFDKAGIPTFITPNIHYELWRKLLINNGVNPLSAVTGLDTKKLTSHPIYSKTVYRLMQETAQASRADQVSITQADVEEMFNLIKGFDAIKTSMLVDREMGRPLEVEAICGAVIERHQKLGTQAPLNELMMALLTPSQN